jgi:hypothetical protein
MNRDFRKLLLCLLLAQILPACGIELDDEVAAFETAELDQAELNWANGDVRPSTPEPVRLVLAKEASGQASVQATEPLGLILIDRSASMNTIRPSTMRSRCFDAVDQAISQVNIFAGSSYNVKSFAVWTFSGTEVVQRTSYVPMNDAIAAIESLRSQPCSGATPLAYAMCRAAYDLDQTRASPTNVAFLAVSTDGFENNSAASPPIPKGNTNCAGPGGDITTTGTWQNNVSTYISSTIGNIKVDDTYWINPTLGTSVQSSVPDVAAPCATEAQCDEKFFATIANNTGGTFRKVVDDNAAYPCLTPGACPAPDTINVGNRFPFSAVNTNGATVNTVNYSVYLLAGETITAGTCGVVGSSGAGDSVLRMFAPSGAQLAFNDDSCGLLSSLTFTVAVTGTYLLSAGCFSINSCSGTVAFMIRGAFAYSAINTNSAMINTANRNVYLRPAQNILFGTCGVAGAFGTGDTYLRLFNRSSTQVAFSDDGCGLLSRISYTVPAGAAGLHQIRAGCFINGSCGGTVPYFIIQP